MTDVANGTPPPEDLLERLYRWSDLIAPLFQHGGIRARRGSKLALTSELARPAILETFLSADLLTVHEHAEALRSTLGGDTPHPRVPFTLLRAGIEAMATSLWLLTPTSRTERARRAILRAVASFRHEEQLRVIGGIEGPGETKRCGRRWSAWVCLPRAAISRLPCGRPESAKSSPTSPRSTSG